jgi:hypothetical protein
VTDLSNPPFKVADFRDLIANMPVLHQAFTSKRSTWASYMHDDDSAGHALRAIFGTSEKVTLSRSDLRSLACKQDLNQFVMAAIIWGYPNGMRGKNFENAIPHLALLTELLLAARGQPVTNWHTHYAEVKRVTGIGLSTYTKFLNSLSAQVQGETALILDDRIIKVAHRGIFEELAPLRKLSYDNAPRFYPRYLESMHRLANSLAVSAEAIEFFLFEFGLNLKRPTDPVATIP